MPVLLSAHLSIGGRYGRIGAVVAIETDIKSVWEVDLLAFSRKLLRPCSCPDEMIQLCFGRAIVGSQDGLVDVFSDFAAQIWVDEL